MYKIIILLFGILFITLTLFSGELLFEKIYKYPEKVEYGVSFSPLFAEYLSLDWQKTYLQIFDELKVSNIRLPSYWNDTERKKDEYDFSKLDFVLSEAEKRGVKVILVLGVRQPRWPECYIPLWAKKLDLRERQQRILQFITKVVQRYKPNQAIKYWQVENEPLLGSFGEGCDAPDKKFLKEEVNLVKSLDLREVILTDSGELGSWIAPMHESDIFGTTLYREVYNPVIGYMSYPILPYLYNLKSQIIRRFFASQNQKTIIAELQAEPWVFTQDLKNKPDQQAKLFPVKKLESYINYAQKTGFDTAYLWGVEWWYWMAQHGHPEYLEYAKTLFK